MARRALTAGSPVISLGESGLRSEGLVLERDVDIRDSSAVDRFVRDVPLNRIDVLVNNAGVFPDPDVGLEGLGIEGALEAFNVNALGAMRVTKACLPLLVQSDSPTILNVSSSMGSLSRTHHPGSYAYRMSKAALNMFTVALATEFPRFKVISVHPGHVRTVMGGPEATVDPAESVEGIWALVRNPPETGSFVDYRRRHLDW